MESNNMARRTEDIALDLLKFVATTANVGSKGAGATGFGPAHVGEVRGPGDAVAGAVHALPSGGRSSYRQVAPVGEGNVGQVQTARPLRVAVVGAGAFGRNHVRVYSELQRSAQG